MPSENENDNFEQLVAGLSNIVGTEEIEAREALGNERYEKLMALHEAASRLALQREASIIRAIESNAFLRSMCAVSVGVATIFGVAWSFVLWFK